MAVPLEDFCEDIVGKAQRGLGLSDADVTSLAGITPEQLQQIKAGDCLEDALVALAAPLQLCPKALVASARKAWAPQPRSVPGLEGFNTPYGDMMVNAYLVWDQNDPEKSASVFDSGADADPIFAAVERLGVRVDHIFLTHTHGDHVVEVDRIQERTRAPIHACEKEPLEKAELFEEGDVFKIASLTVKTRQTTGHSVGGITYVIEGLASPVAIVGDALFAGSMGGGKVSYADALATNRKMIMTLPDDTVLCPGHGPLTTVGEEKQHNPFFPEYSRTRA